AQGGAVAAARPAFQRDGPPQRPRASASGAGVGMIRYSLRCEQGHSFESWFQDSAAYDKQVARDLVSGPSGNAVKVEKAIMAPRIGARKGRGPPPEPVAPTAA